MSKSNMKRQLEIQKELCRLSTALLSASNEDQEFITMIGRLYAIKLKEIQNECINSKDGACRIVHSQC